MADPTDEQDYFGGLGQTLLGKPGVPPLPNGGLGATLVQAASVSRPVAAPDGYISAAYFPGEDHNPFGHVGASINGGPYFGLDPTEGVGALPLVGHDVPSWLKGLTQLGNLVPGEVDLVDPKRQPADQVRIPATAEQIRQFRNYMLNAAGPHAYGLFGPNCSTFVSGALKQAGLQIPGNPGDIDPATLLRDLHRLYDNPTSPPKN